MVDMIKNLCSLTQLFIIIFVLNSCSENAQVDRSTINNNLNTEDERFQDQSFETEDIYWFLQSTNSYTEKLSIPPTFNDSVRIVGDKVKNFLQNYSRTSILCLKIDFENDRTILLKAKHEQIDYELEISFSLEKQDPCFTTLNFIGHHAGNLTNITASGATASISNDLSSICDGNQCSTEVVSTGVSIFLLPTTTSATSATATEILTNNLNFSSLSIVIDPNLQEIESTDLGSCSEIQVKRCQQVNKCCINQRCVGHGDIRETLTASQKQYAQQSLNDISSSNEKNNWIAGRSNLYYSCTQRQIFPEQKPPPPPNIDQIDYHCIKFLEQRNKDFSNWFRNRKLDVNAQLENERSNLS